jgi:hypothetical protein
MNSYHPVCYLRRELASRRVRQPLFLLMLPLLASLPPPRKMQVVASSEEPKAVENDGRAWAKGWYGYEWLER